MRIASLLLLAASAVFAILPAQAQTYPYGRGGAQPRAGYGSYQRSPVYSPRAVNPYARPPGYDGTVRWNTPNGDGNLGGPGVGGGGSGG